MIWYGENGPHIHRTVNWDEFKLLELLIFWLDVLYLFQRTKTQFLRDNLCAKLASPLISRPIFSINMRGSIPINIRKRATLMTDVVVISIIISSNWGFSSFLSCLRTKQRTREKAFNQVYVRKQLNREHTRAHTQMVIVISKVNMKLIFESRK